MLSAKLKFFSSHSSSVPTNLHRIIAGLFFLVILSSWSELDPDPLNLVRPLGGARNLLGLPGALTAGLFVNILGRFSFAIPFILIFLQDKEEARSRAGGYFRDVLWILLANSWFSLLFASAWPTDWHGLAEIAGIWGHYSVEALGFFPGKLASLLILSFLAFRRCRFYTFNMSALILLQSALRLFPAVSNIFSSLSERVSKIRSRVFSKDFFKSLFSKSESNVTEADSPPGKRSEVFEADEQATNNSKR